jgi:outer membrane protein
MNPFRLPRIENCGQLRCARQSQSQHSRSSTMSIALGLILPLAMLTTSMRSTAAEKSADANDVQPVAADANDKPSVSDPFSDKLKFQLGAGVINGARYPGSRYDSTHGVPIVSISYDRYFIGGGPGGGGAPAGIGAYLVRTEHWAVGLDVGGGGRKPRRASDDPILRGWGDIPGTVRGGMFASYNMDWLSVHGSVSVAGHNEGVQGSLGVNAKYHATQRLTLSIGPEATWVNNQYAMTFFGLDAAQSQIAGIAPYRARSGINSVGGSATASYMLTERWSLAAHVSYGRLLGDAANSPVTTDKTQRVYGAFVMYRF